MLTKYNGQTIEYDDIGNPTTYRDGIAMTWQNGRELAVYEKGTTTVNFTYDPNGLRTRKVVEGVIATEYIYEGGKLIQMLYGSNKFDFSYDVNGTPIGFKYTSANSTCI